ncbi:PTS fructose transporter subunit IIB [Levilactobacillus lindianensis]|uniref:PTS fructose transporter subunit IIB n=1 Tax=Levilactobacillus lindianensis TaxID=2486018 RepID=UPI000F744726|nr:fructose PTS transporter subunit IIB [Levilactobacillus lindianensis]
MKIVGVCACTVGIAHTYIAQEKLEKAAEKAGYDIHLETQGTIGTQNELTPEDIADADIAILAIDVKIKGMDRFDKITKMTVPTDIAIKSPNKLMEKAAQVIKQRQNA